MQQFNMSLSMQGKSMSTAFVSRGSALLHGRAPPPRRSRALAAVSSSQAALLSPLQTQPHEHEVLWQRLQLMRRQIEVAVGEEDYYTAALLKREVETLSEAVPPVRRYVLHQVDRLRWGNSQERLSAIRNLGDVGDMSVVQHLVPALQDYTTQSKAAQAMWAIFMRSGNPEVDELMIQGCQLMQDKSTLENAHQVLTQVTNLVPEFAEGWNKRATALYLMHRYAESLSDCHMVLRLNPHHFGAMSGMGLCYMEMQQYERALQCFEAALNLHPNLTQIRGYVETLRAQDITRPDE